MRNRIILPGFRLIALGLMALGVGFFLLGAVSIVANWKLYTQGPGSSFAVSLNALVTYSFMGLSLALTILALGAVVCLLAEVASGQVVVVNGPPRPPRSS